MSERTPKAMLREYLQTSREAMVWKMDGLTEYDIRRPMTDTGTNLLGMVKHLASVEFSYFGDTFDRPSGEPLPWLDPDAEVNADMWVTADESSEYVIDLYRRAWAHADITFDALDLEATGSVPYWTPGNGTSLHHLLVHMIAETHRHAGHADVIRELIDGEAGVKPGASNLPAWAGTEWASYCERLEELARTFR